MAFNQLLADRISFLFNQRGTEIVSKKMFGGITYLYQAKMTVGIIKDDLMVRVVNDKIDELMKLPYVSPMKFTEKPMKEFIQISDLGFKSDFELEKWIDLGLEHAILKLKELNE